MRQPNVHTNQSTPHTSLSHRENRDGYTSQNRCRLYRLILFVVPFAFAAFYNAVDKTHENVIKLQGKEQVFFVCVHIHTHKECHQFKISFQIMTLPGVCYQDGDRCRCRCCWCCCCCCFCYNVDQSL